MKREILRASDFVPAATYRREKGKAYQSKDLRPANLTDAQEASVVVLFQRLTRRVKELR